MASNPYTTNLALQLDARTLSLSDGDAVGTWVDQSGISNDAGQSTAGYKPIYKTNIIGSNPVVRFQGTDDSLFGSFASWSGGSGLTILVLMANFIEVSTPDYAGVVAIHAGGDDYNNASGVAWSCAGQSTYAVRRQWSIVTYLIYRFLIGRSGFVSNTDQEILLPSDGASIVGFGMSNSESAIFSGSGQIWRGATSRTFGSPIGYVLGNRYSSGVSDTAGIAADYAMVVIYKELLSATNARSVMQWMLTEYGLLTASGGGGNIIVVED